MVDILEASGARRPKPGAIVQPTSAVSQGELAAPGVEMGQGLRSLGQALGTLAEQTDAAATPDAQREGLAAVGRDENGNPTVELRPFAMTRSDRAFNEAATQGFLSQVQTQAARGIQEIAQQHALDPAAFDKASKAFVSQLGGGSKILKEQARAEGAKIAQQHFLSISNSAVKQQTAQAKDSVLVQIDTTTNEMYALARGGGVETEEFKAASDRLGGLYDQLKGNPLFGVAPDRVASEVRSTRDRATGFAIAGGVGRVYDEKGEKAAQKWLVESIRDNPNLKIDDTQRNGLLEIGRNTIAARKGENAAAISANKASANVLAKALEDGKAIPPGAVETAIDTAAKLGDVETAAKLLTSRQVYGRNEALRGLPDEERVRVATRGTPVAPAEVGSVITTAADRYGVSHSYALKVGHIESRYDPNAQHPGSKATGLFQFIPSTWKQYGQGQDARDPAANADAAMRFTVANRNQLRASLGREPTDGELYLAHQQGAGGAASLLSNPEARAVDVVGERQVLANGGSINMTAGQFAQLWMRKFDKAPGSGPAGGTIPTAPFTQQQMAANPYLAPTWLRSQMAGNKDLIDSAKYVMSAASNAIDKGNLPDAETLAGALQIAQQNPEQLGRVGEELVAKIRGFDQGEEANRGGAASGAALVEDAMRRAQGAPILVRMQAEAMKAAVERGAKNLQDQPWDEAARRGWSPGALPALDYSSQASFAQGLAARSEVATAISARTGAPQSVLAPSDISGLQGVLRDGSPDQRSMVVAELARMPDEQLGRVMSDKVVKDTLVGMTRSGDASKMSASFSLMDRAKRSDPDGFHAIYGKETENRMAAWTSRQSYLAPQELAKEMAKENDPAVRKARETMRDDAAKKVEKLTAGDIAGYFDQSILPFTAPDAPIQTERGEASQFAAEYKREFAETFAAVGGDETAAKQLAVERLGRVWGESAVSGGRLMKFPPEKSPAHQPINGSHAWIGAQLKAQVRGALGLTAPDHGPYTQEAFGDNPTAEQRRAVEMANAPRVLVSDARTEAEFSAGKPPSYPVVIKAPNGMFVALQNPDGSLFRFVGNEEAAMAPVRDWAERQLADRREVQRDTVSVAQRNARRWGARAR